jgi:hypothetical protein
VTETDPVSLLLAFGAAPDLWLPMPLPLTLPSQLLFALARHSGGGRNPVCNARSSSMPTGWMTHRFATRPSGRREATFATAFGLRSPASAGMTNKVECASSESSSLLLLAL